MSTDPPKPALNVTCKDCGAPMVERENHTTHGRFLGCARYPECKSTQEIPLYVKLIRSGATQLPGFEAS